MKKKILSTVLSFTMVAGILAGCGSNGTTETTTSNDTAASYEAGKSAFSGGGSASGFAVNPDSENAELAAEVAEFITEKYCEAKVMYRHNPLVAIDTGKEPDSEYPAMMKKLSDTLPTITSTTKFTWGLTNSTFNDGIQSETQGLVSGQFTADEFISDMTDVMDDMND